MTPVGETLRRERLKRNLELEEISHELKISTRFLQAIENDQYDKLPGGVFAKSFVRQYARLLGLNEEDLADQVQQILGPAAEVPQFAEKPKAGDRPADSGAQGRRMGDRRRQAFPLVRLALRGGAGCGDAGVLGGLRLDAASEIGGNRAGQSPGAKRSPEPGTEPGASRAAEPSSGAPPAAPSAAQPAPPPVATARRAASPAQPAAAPAPGVGAEAGGTEARPAPASVTAAESRRHRACRDHRG